MLGSFSKNSVFERERIMETLTNEELVNMSQDELEDYSKPLTDAVQLRKIIAIAKHKLAALKEINRL